MSQLSIVRCHCENFPDGSCTDTDMIPTPQPSLLPQLAVRSRPGRLCRRRLPERRSLADEAGNVSRVAHAQGRSLLAGKNAASLCPSPASKAACSPVRAKPAPRSLGTLRPPARSLPRAEHRHDRRRLRCSSTAVAANDRAGASLARASRSRSRPARPPCRARIPGQQRFGNNLQTAAALVAEVGSPHLGLCLDAFHWHVGPSKTEDLGYLTADNLFHVQLCDLADTPRELARDSDRILPGEGDIPLAPLIARLRRSTITAASRSSS